MAASRTTKNYFEALAGVGSDPESAPGEREAASGAGAAANRARCVTIPPGRKCAWPARRSSCLSATASVFQRKPKRSWLLLPQGCRQRIGSEPAAARVGDRAGAGQQEELLLEGRAAEPTEHAESAGAIRRTPGGLCVRRSADGLAERCRAGARRQQRR